MKRGRKKNGKTLDCAVCGEPFYIPLCRLKRTGARAPKYCSAGCRSVGQQDRIRHGHARRRSRDGNKSATYISWLCMKNRATNINDPHWEGYGGRGITVCAEWLDDFAQFLADMGECPPGLEIERIDNDKGYYPGNCKWGTRTEQNRNKRSSRLITHDGRTQCLMAWAEEVGLQESTIRVRLNSNWPVHLALTVPPRPGNRVYFYQ